MKLGSHNLSMYIYINKPSSTLSSTKSLPQLSLQPKAFLNSQVVQQKKQFLSAVLGDCCGGGGCGGGATISAMAGLVLVFDFDKTLINVDSDDWVVEEFGLTELLSQLRPTLPWNRLMDRMLMEIQSKGNTIEDIADCLKRVRLHPKVISVLKSARASGCDLRILSDANVFFIKTILNNNGVLDCFSEMNTNPRYVDGQGRFRVSPYHDFESSSHGCNICPPNMCKGLIMERIQACVSSSGKRLRFIFVGDGTADFCPGLRLAEDDFLIPRKNFPVWELICRNPKLIKPNIHEWNDGEELGTVLSNLINKIFIEEKCSTVGVNQMAAVDCIFRTSSASFRSVLPVSNEPNQIENAGTDLDSPSLDDSADVLFSALKLITKMVDF